MESESVNSFINSNSWKADLGENEGHVRIPEDLTGFSVPRTIEPSEGKQKMPPSPSDPISVESSPNYDQLQREIHDLKQQLLDEKEFNSTQMLQKNRLFDQMRIRIKRYEFCLSEAILFLSKPLLTYDDWLRSETLDGRTRNPLEGFIEALASVNPAYLELSNRSQSISTSNNDEKTGSALSLNPSARDLSRSSSQKSPSSYAEPKSKLSAGKSRAQNSPELSVKSSIEGARSLVDPSALAQKQKMQQTDLFGPLFPPLNANMLEVQSMECLRLAHNYLKTTQKAIQIMDATDANRPANSQRLLNPLKIISHEAEEEFLRKFHSENLADSNPAANSEIQTPRSHVPVASQVLDKDKSLSFESGLNRESAPIALGNHKESKGHSRSRSEFISRSPPGFKASIAPQFETFSKMEYSVNSNFMEEDDGDMGSMTQARESSASESQRGKCPSCRSLMLQLDHANDAIKTAESKITALHQATEAERANANRVRQSKNILDQELEELTGQLFETANQMVIEESILREKLEEECKQLNIQLKSIYRKIDDQNKEIKRIKDSDVSTETLGVFSKKSVPDFFPHPIMHGEVYYAGFKPYFEVDGIILSEFQEHIKVTVDSSSLTAAQALSAFQTTVFMKRCLLEDVEPCIFYYYAPGVLGSLVLRPLGSLSNFFKRRVVDCLFKNSVDIEPLSSAPPLNIEETTSTQADSDLKTDIRQRARCGLCQYVRFCSHRMIFNKQSAVPAPISTGKPLESIQLCSVCRDRAAIVLDFFTFLHYIRQGLVGPGKQGASLLGIFRHVTWLRRKMAQCRVGSPSLFEQQVFKSIDGRVEDWEKNVHIVGSYTS